MPKVNPRRVPRTQADVDRALEQGKDAGITGALVIMLYCLKDKFDFSDEELHDFALAFNKTVEEIREKRISEADLKTVVKEEYGTKLVYT